MTHDAHVKLSRGYTMLVGVLLLVIIAVLCGQVDRELQFDEPIYLNVAKQINATGTPLRSSYDDLTQQNVFGNSPPGVLYFTAITQRFAPSDAVPSRLAQMFFIALPTLVLIGVISYRKFGPAAAMFALLLVLFTGTFLDEAFRVRLDVPLALLSLLALWSYYLAVESENRWQLWALVSAVSLAAAVWTKYQAVCIAAAIGVHWLASWQSQPRESSRRRTVVLGILVVTGALATAALWWYFDALREGGFLSIIRSNRSRISGADESWGIYLLRQAVMLFRTISYIGWPLLVLAVTGIVRNWKTSSLTRLLTYFCLATVAFNVWSVHMPGAGNYYNTPIIPILAILAGAAAKNMWETSNNWRVVVVVLIAAQAYFNPPPLPSLGGRLNRFEEAARYIREHSEPGDCVLSTDVSIEFYSDRPTGVLEYTSPEIALQSLRGESPHNIRFVVLPMEVVPRQPYAGMLTPIWDDVYQLLNSEFQRAAVNIPGMVILERNESSSAAPDD